MVPIDNNPLFHDAPSTATLGVRAVASVRRPASTRRPRLSSSATGGGGFLSNGAEIGHRSNAETVGTDGRSIPTLHKTRYMSLSPILSGTQVK